MGTIASELTRAAREAGAELLEGAAALAIEPARSSATVRYSDGESELIVVAGRVLVGAAPTELARLLGRPAARVAPEGAQVKVNMLLSRLPRLRDPDVGPERAFAGTFHVNELLSQLDDAHHQASAGRLPVPVPCEAYCHSLTDPSILSQPLRVDGVQTLTVFALQTPARLFAEDRDRSRAAALGAILSSLDSLLAEPIEDCLLLAPDGRPCIEARTPLDLEEELRMPGGHIFHRDLSWPFAESEEEVGSWGVETDEPAVLLCGAGARRGGGVSGIPGRNAAMAALVALGSA